MLAEYPQLAEVKLDRLVYWMESHYPDQQIIDERKSKAENREWKTIGVKVRIGELPLLDRQLARFNYDTLGDLVRGLIAGKITQVTEDEQIEIMKTNLQTNGQLTGLSGKPYEFYKQIDVADFLKYLGTSSPHPNY
jgi:hypothetical protein